MVRFPNISVDPGGDVAPGRQLLQVVILLPKIIGS